MNDDQIVKQPDSVTPESAPGASPELPADGDLMAVTLVVYHPLVRARRAFLQNLFAALPKMIARSEEVAGIKRLLRPDGSTVNEWVVMHGASKIGKVEGGDKPADEAK